MNARRFMIALVIAAFATIPTLAHAQESSPPAPVAAPESPAPANPDLVQSVDEARKASSDHATRAVVGVELDHAFLRMYDMALQTTGARLGLGMQTHQITAWAIGDFGVGSLGTSGLHASAGSLGFELMARALTFLRLGGGGHIGYLSVSRVTSLGTMDAFSFGGFLSAKLDLYDFGSRDDHGFYLGTRIDLDLYQGNGQGDPLVWGPELFAGFRY